MAKADSLKVTLNGSKAVLKVKEHVFLSTMEKVQAEKPSGLPWLWS